jgi:hypothetical protein
MRCYNCKKILVDDIIEECEGVICLDCMKNLYPKEFEIQINKTKLNFKGDNNGVKEVIIGEE